MQSLKYEYFRQPPIPEDETALLFGFQRRYKEWELIFIAEGEGLREISGTSRRMQAGTLTLMPPDMPSTWYFSSGTAVATLRFPDDIPTRLAAAMPEWENAAKFFENRAKAWDFKKTQANIIGSIMLSMRHESEAMRAASLMEILTRIAGTVNPVVAGTTRYKAMEEERAARLADYLRQTPLDTLSLDTVSAQMEMNRTTFCNFFKKTQGITFIDYMNSRKVAEACRMLRTGKYTLQDACTQNGFGSMTYFIRVFKKITGETPSRWAKNNTAHP